MGVAATDEGVVVRARFPDGAGDIGSTDVLATVADLVRTFRGEVAARLAAREDRQRLFDAGQRPGPLPESAALRAAEWIVRPAPPVLADRRVEITGPTDRKMVINALNSGAQVYMADLEDATTPTWANVTQGLVNLRDAARGTLDYVAPDGRRYALAAQTAVLMARPRGWHLVERHVEVDGQPIPAALFDAAVYVQLCAGALLARGLGPYLYLPKLESHLEARLWNRVFERLEDQLDLPYGSIRCTVLVETLPAVFELDEILWELRDRVLGLNCGRWDYIFSFLKVHRNDPRAILPDRTAIAMTQPFLRDYARLVIETCHRRGTHALGGMAAQIPIKGDPVANDAALAAVRADKEREVAEGHDGTWVAHPGLVAVAREVFDRGMPAANQLSRRWLGRVAEPAALLALPQGPRTEAGLRLNLRVAVTYLAAWLDGSGCVPIDHRMEDAATAEISRAQVWQWVQHRAVLDDGRRVDAGLVERVLAEEVGRMAPTSSVDRARDLVRSIVLAPELVPFVTVPAYASLLEE